MLVSCQVRGKQLGVCGGEGRGEHADVDHAYLLGERVVGLVLATGAVEVAVSCDVALPGKVLGNKPMSGERRRHTGRSQSNSHCSGGTVSMWNHSRMVAIPLAKRRAGGMARIVEPTCRSSRDCRCRSSGWGVKLAIPFGP